MGWQQELEITVLSATHLHNVRKLYFGTMNPYAVAWIDSHSKAATHVAERGGANPSWNCPIRMLCRECLFGRVAKAKLTVEVLDSGHKKKLLGTANVLLTELLQANVDVRGCQYWSEPKRVTLDVRRLRRGSCQQQKVVGSVDIQVRFGRAANWDALPGAVTYYNGVPVQVHDGALDQQELESEDQRGFNKKRPAAQKEATGEVAPVASVYYQHAYVEKPKTAWRGILDRRQDGRLGILALGVFI